MQTFSFYFIKLFLAPLNGVKCFFLAPNDVLCLQRSMYSMCFIVFDKVTTMGKFLGPRHFVGLWGGRVGHYEAQAARPDPRQAGQWASDFVGLRSDRHDPGIVRLLHLLLDYDRQRLFAMGPLSAPPSVGFAQRFQRPGQLRTGMGRYTFVVYDLWFHGYLKIKIDFGCWIIKKIKKISWCFKILE